MQRQLSIDRERLTAFCRRYHIRKLAFFGSVLRDDFRPDSDVDVVFDVVGDLDYWRLGGLSMDLQDALARRVDLVDREMMKPERWAWMSRDLVPI